MNESIKSQLLNSIDSGELVVLEFPERFDMTPGSQHCTAVDEFMSDLMIIGPLRVGRLLLCEPGDSDCFDEIVAAVDADMDFVDSLDEEDEDD